MVASPDFARAQADAHEFLLKSPDGHLPLCYRKCLWRAMGAKLAPSVAIATQVGPRRRVILARLAVERVLDVWLARWPNDNRPNEMLALAEALLRDSVNREVVRRRKDDFWGQMESLVCEEPIPATNVGFASINVVTAALNDEVLDGDESKSDASLDPYEWDAGFYASAAYADGFPWEVGSSTERRREFWMWWISQAASNAWTHGTL